MKQSDGNCNSINRARAPTKVDMTKGEKEMSRAKRTKSKCMCVRLNAHVEREEEEKETEKKKKRGRNNEKKVKEESMLRRRNELKNLNVTENNDETKLMETAIRSTADARAAIKSRCD